MRVSCVCIFLGAMLMSCSCAHGPSISDSVYYGYEPMFNLSLEEDPSAEWFHANVLTVKGSHLTIEKSPEYLTQGDLWFSSSDGGSFTFQGDIITIGARTIVAMRMVKCYPCRVRKHEDPEEKLPTEYVVKYFKDGSFELDHVRYRLQKDRHFEPKPDAEKARSHPS